MKRKTLMVILSVILVGIVGSIAMPKVVARIQLNSATHDLANEMLQYQAESMARAAKLAVSLAEDQLEPELHEEYNKRVQYLNSGVIIGVNYAGDSHFQLLNELSVFAWTWARRDISANFDNPITDARIIEELKTKPYGGICQLRNIALEIQNIRPLNFPHQPKTIEELGAIRDKFEESKQTMETLLAFLEK